MNTSAHSPDEWLARLSGVYTLWPLAPAGIVGVVSGYLASGVQWINKFGPFGWWSFGVLGFFFAALSFFLLAAARDRWVKARATADWMKEADSINPMQGSFEALRISIQEIAHPYTGRITKKSFTNCELIGKSNIVLAGSGTANGVSFFDCDFVVIRQNVFVKNVVVFEDCNISGGAIWHCTIFADQDFYDRLKTQMPNISCVTYESQK